MALPNFDLAPLSSFDVNVLTDTSYATKEELAFIIAASCAYNDMKDYFWLFEILRENPPPDPNAITPSRGQHTAMIVFIERGLISVFHEFLKLLRSNKEILTRSAIQHAASQLSGEPKQSWVELLRFATVPEDQLTHDEKTLLTTVRHVRDNVCSHYFGTKNYSEGFGSYVASEQAPKVYASFGETMEATRYFFADAAAQYGMKRHIDNNSTNINDVLKNIRKMNFSLRFLIQSFLDCQNKILNGNREERRIEYNNRKIPREK